MANLAPEQFRALQDRYLARTRKYMPEKLTELAHMHLAFLLDLDGDKLEALLTGDEGKQKKKSGLSSVNVFKKKGKQPSGSPNLFGHPLTDEGVRLMVPLFKYLKNEQHLAFEGIFRKSGNKLRMRNLRDLLEETGSKTIIDADIYLPTDITGVLKEFLRELPDPLLTERLMEAYKQILSLGQYAATPEAVARSERKKISALQLLLLLTPEPSRIMTLRLVRVLARVASLPVTKMTPDSLGTVLSPLFCVDRKVEGEELRLKANEYSPILALMIQHANELSLTPKEFVLDLIYYWDNVDNQNLQPEESSNKGQKAVSPTGSTIQTNICYIDREMSRCDDIASNTQTELESLYAHIQSLPDTPHNMKLKKQVLKATTTPTSSAKKHNRSKSIGASIKKRLPSLTRSRNRRDPRFSVSSASSTSSEDSKSTTTPAIRDLLKSPCAKSTGKFPIRLSRPRHKRRHTTDTDSPLAASECTPPKQEYRPSYITPGTPRSYKTETNIPNPHPQTENEISVQIIDDSQQIFSKGLEKDDDTGTSSYLKMDSPKPLTPQNYVGESEKEISYLPNQASCQLHIAPSPVSQESRPVARVQPRPFRPHGTPIMRRTLLQIAKGGPLESSI